MGVMFLPSKIPPKRPLPMDYDSDDSDDDMGMGAAGGGGSGAASPAPFSCDPEGALFRLRPLSYRCPDQAPAARLKTLPLGLLPLPHQLPGEPAGGVGIVFVPHTPLRHRLACQDDSFVAVLPSRSSVSEHSECVCLFSPAF